MLYIVRHCSTLDSQNNILLSDSDLELTETGILEAQKLSQWFEDKQIDIILSSSLKRASQTADILNINLKTSIVFLDDLKEREVDKIYSSHKFRELDKLRASMNHKYFDATQDWENVINVESDESVFLRIKNTLEPFLASKENIVVVTHAGVIKSFLHSIFQLSKTRANAFKIKRGSVLVLDNMKDFDKIQLIGMYSF